MRAARPALDRLLEPLRAVVERDKLRFVARPSPGARVLEVGAGDGRFVFAAGGSGLRGDGDRALRGRGPDGAGAGRARGAGDARGRCASSRRASTRSIAWHVLEHLGDPAAALRGSAAGSAPAAGSWSPAPTSASLQARIGGDRWFHQDVPRHRTHFTAAGLQRLLRAHAVSGRADVAICSSSRIHSGCGRRCSTGSPAERDVAFRALKRDLDHGAGDRAGTWR